MQNPSDQLSTAKKVQKQSDNYEQGRKQAKIIRPKKLIQKLTMRP